jgi:hypothetical protein
MRYTVMVVEPNLDERKEIIRTLIHAGYDALPVDPGAVLGELYRLNYEMGFDDTVQAVILSDNVPTDYVRALYRCLAEMKQLAVIGYGEKLLAEAVTYRISRSTDYLLILLREVCDSVNLSAGRGSASNFAVQNDSQYLAR